MKTKEFLEKLETCLGFKPKVEVLANILGHPSEQTIYGRSKRDSNFPDEEIEKIEDFYGIDLTGGNNDCVELDYFPDVFGSCGTGVFVLAEDKEKISLSKANISNYSPGAKYSVINAYGDSMQPFIQDKDKLVVKHWNGEQIKDNNVYVFRYVDEIFVKRLSKNIDQIIIKSDNPLYDTRKISLSPDFQIIGQIVGLMREMD